MIILVQLFTKRCTRILRGQIKWGKRGRRTQYDREAAEFAERAHEGVYRKGTKIPYITHPMETAAIVTAFTNEPEMIAAALLHDVIEDAGVTKEELEEKFGSRVAFLVESESEDKSRSWMERKGTTVEHLKSATRDEKILALADKLSNIRSTVRDYLVPGR